MKCFCYPVFLCRLLSGIFFSSFLCWPVLAQLSVQEINAVARQTTVLIAPGLSKEYIEALERNRGNPHASKNDPNAEWHPGSGVIIAKTSGTKNQYAYYVLTVTHNFETSLLNQNTPYGILTTIDNELHKVEETNDGRGCPLTTINNQKNLIRFGCLYRDKNQRKVEGNDLAVIRFESDKNYFVASSGDSSKIKTEDTVYISGWPDPERETDPTTGGCRGKEIRRQRRLAWGSVRGITSPNAESNGYSIFYVDVTRPGMSGGPVFDSNGRVIGVHGRGSRETTDQFNLYCDISAIPANNALQSGEQNSSGTSGDFSNRYSSAQSVNSALELLNKANINLPLNQQLSVTEMLKTALSPVPNYLMAQKTGIFDDPNDIIENIYDKFNQFKFTFQNRIGDCPLGHSFGCE